MKENLVSVDAESLKEIQLRILKVVADFCEKNDIKYWLDFGTLLGAVRHKGYIPWDDDIDITMLRPDFERFLELFNAQNDRYKVYSYQNNKDFLYPFAKVLDTETVLYEPDEKGNKLSINIDVFVFDNAPSDKEIEKIYAKKRFYNLCQVARTHKGRVGGGLFRRLAAGLLKLAVKLFPKDYFVKKIVKGAKKYSGIESDRVCDFYCPDTSFVCDKALFESFIDAEFENGIYKIPAKYHEVLQMYYGDYMTLPPEEERVTHHKFIAYTKNSQ